MRWHDGHADRAGDWWPSSVPLTNQLSTTRTHTEQGVQIHLLWEFMGWISEEAWDQVLYHWRRSSSSTFKQDVLQLLSTFSTILVPSNSNLIYPIWLISMTLNSSISVASASACESSGAQFCGQRALRATGLATHWTLAAVAQAGEGRGGALKTTDLDLGLHVFLFQILFEPKLLYPSSAWVNACAFGFWVYQWLSIFRDKKCQFREAHYKGRTAKNKTEEFPWDVGMCRMEDTGCNR